MKSVLLNWLARYDAWCEEWGLVQENRRCCVPVRRDEEESKAPLPVEEPSSLTESCGSRRQ